VLFSFLRELCNFVYQIDYEIARIKERAPQRHLLSSSKNREKRRIELFIFAGAGGYRVISCVKKLMRQPASRLESQRGRLTIRRRKIFGIIRSKALKQKVSAKKI
jgi:hypothetical protein